MMTIPCFRRNTALATETNKEYSMTSIAPTVSAVLNLPAPANADGQVIQEIVADLRTERLAIVATDALGDFTWRLWQDEMPFLKSLHEQHHLLLRAVMPTITPVNFATMIAGTTRDVHGIGAFTDDFQCETLFDVVRAAGERSAGIGQIGCTGSKLLARFADIRGQTKNRSDAEVEELIIRIATNDVPQFLIAQLVGTDRIFHKFGPSSPEVVPKLQETDERLQRLVQHLSDGDYAIIVLSDHGQHDVVKKDGGSGGSHGSDSDADSVVPCTWSK